MEAEYNHLNHATWECKYHVAFTPTYRKKVLFGARERMRVVLGAVDDGRQGQQLYRHGGFSACAFGRSFRYHPAVLVCLVHPAAFRHGDSPCAPIRLRRPPAFDIELTRCERP